VNLATPEFVARQGHEANQMNHAMDGEMNPWPNEKQYDYKTF
jgi:hypothetical protein